VPVVHRGTRASRSAHTRLTQRARGVPVDPPVQARGVRWRGSGAVLEAPAVVACLDDIAVVREAVEQRCGHFGIAKNTRPFTEGEIRGDDDRRAFVEAAYCMEQQLAAGLSERQIAELVEDNEVETGEEVSEPTLPSGAALGLKTIDQVDRVEEAPPSSAADTASGNRDRKMISYGLSNAFFWHWCGSESLKIAKLDFIRLRQMRRAARSMV
jgi:hypothetical protein